MTAHRSILLLALGVLLAGPTSAQTFVLKAGPSLLAGSIGPTTGGDDIQANLQIGARTWLTDLFQLQGTIGYTNQFSAEGTVQIRPYGQGQKIEPYGFFGYSYLFAGEGRETVFPIGLGVEYHTDQNLGVFFEIAGRWQSGLQARTEQNRLDFYVAPTVGVAYALNPGRPAPRVATARTDWRPAPPEPRASAASLASGTPSNAASSPTAYRQRSASNEPSEFESLRGPELTLVEQEAWAEWEQLSDKVDLLGDKVRIPDGTFIMGLTDEDPLMLQTAGLKRVTISAFVIDRHEVSNADYMAYIEDNAEAASEALMPDASAWVRAGSSTSLQDYFLSGAYPDYPVTAVTWQQANDFCAYAGGRLPTEAEWEYAARSGLPGGIYPWPGLEPINPAGAHLANYNPGRGLYAADGYAFTAPVESFWPTPWGIYNISGNVAEWVNDSYSASYSALSNFNPTYVDPGEPRRIVRGGSWASDDFYIGVGVRDAQLADEATIFTGFRCAYGLDAVADMQEESEVSPASAEPEGEADSEGGN